jgi:hypothetical protein
MCILSVNILQVSLHIVKNRKLQGVRHDFLIRKQTTSFEKTETETKISCSEGLTSSSQHDRYSNGHKMADGRRAEVVFLGLLRTKNESNQF